MILNENEQAEDECEQIKSKNKENNPKSTLLVFQDDLVDKENTATTTNATNTVVEESSMISVAASGVHDNKQSNSRPYSLCTSNGQGSTKRESAAVLQPNLQHVS